MKVAENADFLGAVMRHPDVWPWMVPDHRIDDDLDLATIFDQGIGLEFEGGGFFFHRLGDGVFEVHTLFLPGSKHAFEAAQAAATYMFCATECMSIVTKVPEDNVPAWKLTERMGFALDYTRAKAYTRKGVEHDVRHYSLDMPSWMTRQQSPSWVAQMCAELGDPGKGQRALYRWAVMNDDYSVLGD